MKVSATALPEVLLLEPRVFRDARGFFLETWQRDRFAAAGITVDFVQDNHSRSTRGTLRGLHYQVVTPQGKLVRVARGSVFDVAVDIRHSSATFGRWVGVELTDREPNALWIPPGFAHGFYVLSELADLEYKCTEPWSPEHDRVLRWDDKTLNITWPLAAGAPPLLSERDAAAPTLADSECLP
jgi:dTDP-4-dehydrorhamnose 3,5-epimerase